MDLKETKQLLKLLRGHKVTRYKSEGVEVELDYPEQPPTPIDLDARRTDGHRLRPPTSEDISKERLHVW